MYRHSLLVVCTLVACSTPSSTVLDGGPGDDPPAVYPPADHVGGVIAIAEREVFCTELAVCDADLDYADCIAAVDDSATVLPTVPGCQAPAKLELAIACAKVEDVCGDTACDAALEAWTASYTSAACELEVFTVAIGDRYPNGAADSTCDDGIRAAGGWCTRACSTAQQCAGSGAGGKNHFGTENTCAAETFIGGLGCYPTCTSTADCQAWFGETRFGLRIACKSFDDGSSPAPICVRVLDDRGVELP